MKIGLKHGDRGAEVSRLQRVLAAAGLRIDAAEIEQERFGPSTAEALRGFQQRRRLPEREEIDETTLNELVAVEQNITININPPAAGTSAPPADSDRGTVSGTLVNEDGVPLAQTRIELFSVELRGQTQIGEATTSKQGQYTIHYHRPAALNLVVKAIGEMGDAIATSPTLFQAPATAQVNLTTAPDGVFRGLSIYSKTGQAIAGALHGAAFSDLKENSTTHELQFLANATGIAFEDVAYLFIAHQLGAKYKVRDQTWFGLFYQGVPVALDAALASLPDNGIDAAFLTQVLNGVLADSRASLQTQLDMAVNGNVLPASYASIETSELDLLDGLRTQNTGTTAYIRGKTSLNDLLAAGNVATAAATAFVQAYSASGGQLGPTWTALRANKTLTAAELDTLQTTLSLGELLTGNLPLIKDTLSRLTAGSLASIQNLALLSEADWVTRITAIDPNAASIPQVLPTDTPQQRIARFAQSLARRFAGRYPTTAFAGGLTSAAKSSFSSHAELATFLLAHPTLSFRTTNIDQYLATNKLTPSPAAQNDLKTAQRLFRISPHYATVEALHTAGYKSAQSVYFAGRAPFLAQMTASLGSTAIAQMAWGRAQMMYATALATYARFNAGFNGVSFAAAPALSPDPALIANLPDMQALFGSLDYFQCDDCQSIYSPAAYLVDLLQYLAWFSASGGGVTNPRDALFLRRPDIQYIALDCNNTNTTMPYIDLVNELLESVIAPPNPPVTFIDTAGTSAERRALPQQISQAAYQNTANAVFPLNLPFDLSFAQTTAYLATLGASRPSLLTLFGGNPPPAATAAVIACATLGINPAMQAVITGADANPDFAHWGFPNANLIYGAGSAIPNGKVIDPDTRQPYTPAPDSWVGAMNYVPVLLNRSGLSLAQLYQLLEATWVTESGVTLSLGTITAPGTGTQIVSPDTSLMSFTGLTDVVLDRASRFLRLWTACGLQMWELDWALEAASGGNLDNAFLVFLSGAIAAAGQLNLPFQEALSLWMPLETRDVTNHLGDEDVVQPSTYSEVFRNPAVLASWSLIFPPLMANTVTAATNATPIAVTTALPHGYVTGVTVAITGVVGNTAANGSFVITVTGPNTFTLNASAGNGAWTSGGSVVAQLSGNAIVPAPDGAPTAEQGAITAALGLSANDTAAILNFSGAVNALNLTTLNVLLGYQRLSASLSLAVEDLILWIQLTAQNPFVAGQPAATLEFLRRYNQLQATGLADVDLDYLMRGQSASASSLAFTPAQATAVLQTISAAIVKMPATVTAPVTGASFATPIVITAAIRNGVTTGAQVSIAGVSGNTAANGTFTITVLGANSFSLNGSAGIANWGGGGVVTFAAWDSNAIQTIFVNALAAATGATANVVTPVLASTGILPLAPATIQLLIAQAGAIQASQFPQLVQAFTSVSMAAALFTALKPSESEFTFAVENAATFGWLNPAALPLTPVTASPYAQLESLIRAFKLDQRQPGRSPRLFDVLGAWLPPNAPPATVQAAIQGPSLTVAGATLASPIVITTTTPHGLNTGAQVAISGSTGNTAANGVFTITVTGPATFSLNDSTGNAAWTGGGTVTVVGQLCIATALNASVSDALAIATALGATAPSLIAATQPGSLADMAMLAAIAAILDVGVRYGISGATLVQLAAAPATQDSANAAMGALQRQYSQSTWYGAITPVEDTLRQNRRDALVAYLIGQGPATPVPAPLFLSTDDLFNYYLIDPEMCPCAPMTRLLQASLAIQQYVQQCFLNLSFSGVTVPMTDSRWDEWSWRQQYRLWQANREVFLYPENYVLPETRTDASPFFTELESDMQQANCDEALAETALENYLRKLVGVARLRVVAHYNDTTTTPGSTILHVFARTHGEPAQWYYRNRTTTAGSGSWSAWQPLTVDVADDHLVPFIWDRHLFLLWPSFKQISEKQGDQSVPANGGGSAPASQKYWSVEFAISEFSLGQWQPKQTLARKMYFATEDSPLAFTLRAWQDNNFNLQIQVYFVGVEEALAEAITTATSNRQWAGTTSYTTADFLGSTATVKVLWVGVFFLASPVIESITASGASGLIAQATLPMPESPLQITELATLTPQAGTVDLSQEPSFAKVVTSTSLSGQLTAPASYGFSGQELSWGYYAQQDPANPVVLNVLCATSNTGSPSTIELLGSISSPHVIPPLQEPVFDSADPFFVADPTRSYVVDPSYYTISSNPMELTSTKYLSGWQTRYQFSTFYHPYARTILRQMEIGGVDQAMAPALQSNPLSVKGYPASFSFGSIYTPQKPVIKPYPGDPGAIDVGENGLDFQIGDAGAYSLYNWEVFYHIPMFVAAQLLQNNQFQDALNWLEYIFNPTSSSSQAAPQRFWQFLPFNQMSAATWLSQQIQNLLTTLAADQQAGISDPAMATAIWNMQNDPFDPHAVASTRISAYGKATVMALLNTLIAWGDWYYSQYTAETVSQAEQLYILADMILGPEPQSTRLPSQNGSSTATYASLKNIDLFSNALVNVENLVIAPEPPASVVDGSAQLTTLPQLPGNGSTLLFCIPPNSQMLAYWGTVSQRLYNIRHCLNLQGIAQPLPLYAPPINPLELIEAEQSGASLVGATPPAPIYRFTTYLQRAVELTNDVRSYGALILSALEKEDAENLGVLRANQEVDIQTRILDVKNLQVTEAQDQITALQNQLAVVQVRQAFYSAQTFMNAFEIMAIALQGQALSDYQQAMSLDQTAGVANLVPSFSIGVSGFGGTPTVTAGYGGENVGASSSAYSSKHQTSATITNATAAIMAALGSYQHRLDEWTLQLNIANAEITQVKSQITAATDRLNTANKEVDVQNELISNAQAISSFLTGKYTNAQLYNWMVSQLTTVYTQAYQLAYSLALQAQNAYQYELGSQDTFIQFGYWNSQYKGLTAGESLLFDLRRMETQYLAENIHELELTKHISLALTNPMALVLLIETGNCQVALDEALFDYDYPGQYFRRLRSVALTIPCVTGPYTGVHATLSLSSAMIRTQPAGTSAYHPQPAAQPPIDPAVLYSPTPPAGASVIATSTAQNDAGLFDPTRVDERWYPFECQGAVSTWNLTLDPRDNNFDFSTITDVILHVRYTARGGGDLTSAATVRQALTPKGPRSVLVSVRNTFGSAFYTFFNPPNPAAAQQNLTIPLTANVFPYSNFGPGVKISDVTFYMILAGTATASGNNFSAGVTVNNGASSPLSFAPWAATTTAGAPVQALTADLKVNPAGAAPQTVAIALPAASVPANLAATLNGQTVLSGANVEDILMVITYSIA